MPQQFGNFITLYISNVFNLLVLVKKCVSNNWTAQQLQTAFLLFVSSHDTSECLISYPAGKGLLSCVYLRMKFLVVPINKGLVAYPTGKRLFSCVYLLVTFQNGEGNFRRKFIYLEHAGKWLFFCVYLLMMFQSVFRDILQAKSFSPVCLFS